MKRQIRRNVFETNSSSMHSLVIMKQEEKYTPEEISKGIYLHKDIDTGESCCVWKPWDHEMDFGRTPFRVLGTFADKWLYACASLVNEYNDKIYKELVKLAIKYVPGLKKIKLPMIEDGVVDKNDENYDYDYRQDYGKTEEEFQKYLLQKEKDWELEIRYWKSSDGWWHYDRPYTGHVDEDILSGFFGT